MKRILAIILTVIVLGGCYAESNPTAQGTLLRESMINSTGCEFSCTVNADFGQTEYAFSMECKADPKGKVQFQVVAPETISGIAGYIDSQSGKLTFDDTILTFPLLAQGEIPPVCAPWLFFKALTGGYIRAAGKDSDGLRLTIDDSFQGENLCVEVWLRAGSPVWAEIAWQGRKLLTLDITQFRIL